MPDVLSVPSLQSSAIQAPNSTSASPPGWFCQEQPLEHHFMGRNVTCLRRAGHGTEIPVLLCTQNEESAAFYPLTDL